MAEGIYGWLTERVHKWLKMSTREPSTISQWDTLKPAQGQRGHHTHKGGDYYWDCGAQLCYHVVSSSSSFDLSVMAVGGLCSPWAGAVYDSRWNVFWESVSHRNHKDFERAALTGHKGYEVICKTKDLFWTDTGGCTHKNITNYRSSLGRKKIMNSNHTKPYTILL